MLVIPSCELSPNLWVRCVQTFLETHPQTARINERASVLLDFPDFLCPPGPAVHCSLPSNGAIGAQAASVTCPSAAQGPRCRFHLLAQPGLSSLGGARWQHILLMSSSDQLGAPAQVWCHGKDFRWKPVQLDSNHKPSHSLHITAQSYLV